MNLMLNRVVLSSLLTVILFNCSTHDPRSAIYDLQKEIRISLSTEPPTLDWNLATDNVSYQILNQLMEGLTQFDQNLNPIPAAAKSWEIREEGKTYVFHLDPNYRWSDGKPVTARDFRYSWLRLLKPETAAEYAYFLFDIIGAREFNRGKLKDENRVGIEVIDDLTLRVRLNQPIVFFPAITTFMVTYPLRQDIVEKQRRWTDPENIVTCGPFVLEEWWHEYRLKLGVNPHYGGNPQPSFDRLTIFLVSDPATSLSLYEQNLLDIAGPPPVALPYYKNSPDLMSVPKLRGYYYGFNITKKPFDDPRVRRALAMSLDKREIPNILKGGEQPVDSWIPPGMFGFEEGIGLKFDPEKARELLGQDPRRLQFTLTFNSDPVNKKIAEWAQAQWKKNLGIDVNLDNQEWKSYLSLLKTDPPGLFRLGWGADYPDPDNFMNLFTSTSGNNHTHWKSAEFDSLIAQGSVEKDEQKRKAVYDKAQKMLLEEEAVIIPLFIPMQNVLVKEKLKPFPLIPMDFMYYKRVNLKSEATGPGPLYQ
ncbi:MAG: peptide ABC transporter substrate-binding protein [Deltaproteobacteria bacterium]|nr:peptide ABC transporter substrate-binding protein [Deltaproteobacteria bacterium]